VQIFTRPGIWSPLAGIVVMGVWLELLSAGKTRLAPFRKLAKILNTFRAVVYQGFQTL